MEILMFTELVIAVGSRGPMPGKIFERRAEDASRKYRELGNEVISYSFKITIIYFTLAAKVFRVSLKSKITFRLTKQPTSLSLVVEQLVLS